MLSNCRIDLNFKTASKDVTQRLADIEKRLIELKGERKTAKGRRIIEIDKEIDNLKMEQTLIK